MSKVGQRISLSPNTISIQLELVWIPPGTFWMGSPETESRRGEDEKRHIVTLTKGFFLGIFPVTVGQFRSFTQSANCQTTAECFGGAYFWNGKRWKQSTRTNWQNPGFSQTDQHPVTCVTVSDAENFCKWLSKESGNSIRLPTESEWECACRAGTTTPFSFGETLSTAQANFNGNFIYRKGRKGIFRAQTTPVGTFLPNAWGIYDMHGNVWEWCLDEHGPYPTEEAINPVGHYFDESRILRGGSWLQGPANCRSANRISQEAEDYIEQNKESESQKKAAREKVGSDRCSMVGFRIAMILEE
jgi:formylglycine-generating enzyme